MAKKREERYQSASEIIEDLAPFQSEAMNMMSGMAAGVIKSSFPPTPASIHPNDEASSKGPSQPTAIQPPIGPAVSDAPETHTSQSTPVQAISGIGRRAVAPKESHGGRMVLFLLLAVAVVGLLLFFPAGFGINDSSEGEEPDKTAKEEKPIFKEPVRVTINLVGLPDEARITLDGEKVTSPIHMPRTDKPVILKITAPRYKPYVKAISLSKSQDIEIEMTKKPSRRKSTRKKR